MLDASDNRRLDDFENSDLGNHLALSGWSSQLGTSPPYAPESSNLSIASRRSTYSKRRWRGQILPVDVAGVVVVVVVEAKFAIFAPGSPAVIELLPDCLQLLRIFIRTAHGQIDGVRGEPDIDLVHCLAIFINNYDCATVRNYGEIASFACCQSRDGRFVAVATLRLRLPTFYQYSTTWLIIAYTRTPP